MDWTIYIFNIRNLPLNTLHLQNLISVLNIGLAAVVLSAIAVRFVFSSVSIEGSYFWIIRTAPMKPSVLLWEKFWINLFPLLLLSETLVIVSNYFLMVDLFVSLHAVVSILLITISLVGLGVGIGAKYPVFKFENVAEIAMSSGGILYMILSFLYIGAIVVAVSRPIYVHLANNLWNKNIEFGLGVYLCYLFMGILTLLITILPMRIGVKSLERLEN